jgi:hypothetical protein
MIQKKSFDLAFHFSFNQNKLWINWRIVDHVSNAYVACVGLFGHLFWNKRSFWQQCQIISCHIRKLSANDRWQTETLLHHVSLAAQCLGSIIGWIADVDTWSTILQFIHNLYWLKLKWNARSNLFYCIIYRFSMLWWSSRTLTKLKSQSQKRFNERKYQYLKYENKNHSGPDT